MYELWRAPLHRAGHWTYPVPSLLGFLNFHILHFTSYQQYSFYLLAECTTRDFTIEEFMKMTHQPPTTFKGRCSNCKWRQLVEIPIYKKECSKAPVSSLNKEMARLGIIYCRSMWYRCKIEEPCRLPISQYFIVTVGAGVVYLCRYYNSGSHIIHLPGTVI